MPCLALLCQDVRFDPVVFPNLSVIYALLAWVLFYHNQLDCFSQQVNVVLSNRTLYKTLRAWVQIFFLKIDTWFPHLGSVCSPIRSTRAIQFVS
jgi:hypothetical protein